MRRKRWALVAAAAAGVVLVVPAVGQGNAQDGSLHWSLSRGGHAVTSYDVGAVDPGSTVTKAFRLGSSSSTKSEKLAISLSGSSAYWIEFDQCSRKRIGQNTSCWVWVTYGPPDGATPDSATLTAKAEHGPAATLTLSGGGTGPASGPVSWGSAIDVSGGVNTLSCSSAGECAAGGSYTDGAGKSQASVVSETGGVWGTAIEVPGTAALNVHGIAQVTSISCATAGNCAAGGSYFDSDYRPHAFLVSEKGGVWGTAIGVPGVVSSISCPSPGNCVAAGGSGVFVMRNGKWDAAFKAAPSVFASSVSCGGVGECVAGGGHYDRHSLEHAVVAVERNGTWGRRTGLPGMATLTRGGPSWVTNVSCARPGNCAVVGLYMWGTYHVFVAEEKGGKWGQATSVDGLAGSYLHLTSLSCASPGNCAAGGDVGDFYVYNKYGDGDGSAQAFVVSERSGKWDKAIAVPGIPPVGDLEFDRTNSVSCASAGNCAATGGYVDVDGSGYHAFVVAERSGVWGTAEDVPGAEETPGSESYASAVSCAPAGNCAIGGFSSGLDGAFVTAP